MPALLQNSDAYRCRLLRHGHGIGAACSLPLASWDGGPAVGKVWVGICLSPQVCVAKTSNLSEAEKRVWPFDPMARAVTPD
jgi:hypothetical protein